MLENKIHFIYVMRSLFNFVFEYLNLNSYQFYRIFVRNCVEAVSFVNADIFAVII